MNQTISQRRELKRAIPEWREHSRRSHDSDIHRTALSVRSLALDLLGGLLILPLTVLFVVELYGLVLMFGGEQ